MLRACVACGRPYTPTRGVHRCASCYRAQVRRRGTPTERGYGADHQRARRALGATLPAPCGYCGVTIEQGARYVAAHVVDGDPTAGYVVAHAGCNERAKVRGGRSETGDFPPAIPAPRRAHVTAKVVTW